MFIYIYGLVWFNINLTITIVVSVLYIIDSIQCDAVYVYTAFRAFRCRTRRTQSTLMIPRPIPDPFGQLFPTENDWLALKKYQSEG